MSIEAILFDLGKVLIDFDFEIGLRSMRARCRIPADQFKAILLDQKWIRGYETGRISTEEFHQYLCSAGGLDMDLAEFCETWSSIFLPNLIVSERLLRSLKTNYPLILVPKSCRIHPPPLHLHAIFCSSDLFP
jgi:putative hydrolase of the HAD superfamily